jgi:hypothetical protein
MKKTHWLIIWTIGNGREVPPRACVDDTGNLIAFATETHADAFAARLADYGLSAAIYPVSSRKVAELVAHNAPTLADAQQIIDHVSVPEAQALDAEDAEQWARELADRFMRRLVDEWASAAYNATAPNVVPLRTTG